ncbi:MAG: formimidoylglutamase [Deltaproteobacteria bacterium]|nr:formimidoylglutamase [Deltaproteobacteria bacterium]MBI4373911.1 formimidoylglutamase [Deltaproteobacteria bacterium]
MDSWSRKIKSGDYRYALIGFPEDRGVRTNKGRPGAAQGPAAIRRALSSGVDFKKFQLVDLGDVPDTDSLLERQRWLGSAVQRCFEANVFPIVLGGGHETAYGHYLGYRSPPSVLSIDAHLDCRPLVRGIGHSGSPFRQMIEDPENPLPPENLIEFGIQKNCNSGENLQFVLGKKVRLFWLDEISKKGIDISLKRILDEIKEDLYATIDLDGLNPLEFPATSAAVKMKEGFSVKEMEEMIRLLARHPALTSLDFCEYSPPFDSHSTCAKAIAMFLCRFLAQRLQSPF